MTFSEEPSPSLLRFPHTNPCLIVQGCPFFLSSLRRVFAMIKRLSCTSEMRDGNPFPRSLQEFLD